MEEESEEEVGKGEEGGGGGGGGRGGVVGFVAVVGRSVAAVSSFFSLSFFSSPPPLFALPRSALFVRCRFPSGSLSCSSPVAPPFPSPFLGLPLRLILALPRSGLLISRPSSSLTAFACPLCFDRLPAAREAAKAKEEEEEEEEAEEEEE